MESLNEEDHFEINERVAYVQPSYSTRQGVRVGTVVARREKFRSVNVHMRHGYHYDVQWDDIGTVECHYNRALLQRVERLNSHEIKP